MEERKAKPRKDSKPPAPDYDRFGFKRTFREADAVHWSRPWTMPSDTAESLDPPDAGFGSSDAGR